MGNKKGFTLIEMLIVIVIIWILMTISMWISWDRVRVLKTKAVEEQILYNYNNLFSKNMLTNYYSWELYKDLKIVFTEWNSSFQYYYNKFDGGSYTWNTFLQSGKYNISEILGDNNRNLRNVNIIFYPYELWCKISAVEQSSNRTNNNSNNPISSLKIKFLVNDNEDYCVKLSSDLCKMERIDCF